MSNKAVVRRFYEPFRTGDTSSYQDILTPEWGEPPRRTRHHAGAPPVGLYRQVLPDLVSATEAMIAEGDLAAVRTTHRAAPTAHRRILNTSQPLLSMAATAIARYTEPGDMVADPMCGVGTTLAGAVHLGRDGRA